jgi:hypothetical protein
MPTFCGSDVVYSGCFMRISDMTKKPRSNGMVSGLQSVKFGGSSMFSCINDGCSGHHHGAENVGFHTGMML